MRRKICDKSTLDCVAKRCSLVDVTNVKIIVSLSDALSCRFTNGTYASQCNTYPGVAKRCTGAFLASLHNTPICVATQYRLLRRLATRSSREASLNLERRRLATYLATGAIAVAKRRYNLKFGPSLMAQYVVVLIHYMLIETLREIFYLNPNPKFQLLLTLKHSDFGV